MRNIAYKMERANRKSKKTNLFLKKAGVLQKKWKKILIFHGVAGKLPYLFYQETGCIDAET